MGPSEISSVLSQGNLALTGECKVSNELEFGIACVLYAIGLGILLFAPKRRVR